MKKIRWFVAVVAFSLVATACGGADPTVSTASSESIPVGSTAVPADAAGESAGAEPEATATSMPERDDATESEQVEAPEPDEAPVAADGSAEDGSVEDVPAEEAPAEEPTEVAPEPTEVVEEAAPVDDGLSVEERAAQNAPTLVSSDHPFDYQVLNAADGTVATLRDVVDGDRPVLLWFWSPH